MTDTPNLSALAMRTRAAEACDAQSAVFLSAEYATGQPLSSFQERFACGQVKDAILALPLEADPAALVAEALKLPEIVALVEVANKALKDAVADEMDAWFAELKTTLAALVQP